MIYFCTQQGHQIQQFSIR